MFKRLFDTRRSIPSINVQEAWERVTAPNTTAMMIDVRETWEFKQGQARRAEYSLEPAWEAFSRGTSRSRHLVDLPQRAPQLAGGEILASRGMGTHHERERWDVELGDAPPAGGVREHIWNMSPSFNKCGPCWRASLSASPWA